MSRRWVARLVVAAVACGAGLVGLNEAGPGPRMAAAQDTPSIVVDEERLGDCPSLLEFFDPALSVDDVETLAFDDPCRRPTCIENFILLTAGDLAASIDVIGKLCFAAPPWLPSTWCPTPDASGLPARMWIDREQPLSPPISPPMQPSIEDLLDPASQAFDPSILLRVFVVTLLPPEQPDEPCSGPFPHQGDIGGPALPASGSNSLPLTILGATTLLGGAILVNLTRHSTTG